MKPLKLLFEGATETVTGSCTLVKANDKNILIDCGLYEGNAVEHLNSRNFNFNPKDIDYILLTHAHIDHSGRIPYLVKKGFRGKVICTKPTKDLCDIMLPDSGYIQQKMKKWDMPIKKKNDIVLYDMEDAYKSLTFFEYVDYNKEIELEKDIKIKMINSGHMLGSAFIEMYISENGKETKIVFTGDIGNQNNNMLPNYEKLESADIVVIEATYGDRLHDETISVEEQIKQAIIDTVKQNGKLLIPAFAVGRTQEIVKYIKNIYESIDEEYKVPVYVDSPLAIKAFDKFMQNTEHLNEEIKRIYEVKEEFLSFKELKLVSELDESMYLSTKDESMIIIAASGMADFGRVKQHLMNNISDERNTIMFSGYVAEGTLGREIKKGKRNIKIGGEKYKQRAKIKTLQGMSGHVDMQGLIDFIRNFSKKPKQIYINHGNGEAKENLQKELSKVLCKEAEVIIPKRDIIYEIKNIFTTRIKPKFDLEEFYSQRLSAQEKILFSIYGEGIENYAHFQSNSEVPNDEQSKKKIGILNKLGYWAG
ncbi:MAG TPA: MBL fold hydrolase [Clostridiales bacterium]|nr:MBL fold hydrolase [Clostridiales bacterium]